MKTRNNDSTQNETLLNQSITRRSFVKRGAVASAATVFGLNVASRTAFGADDGRVTISETITVVGQNGPIQMQVDGSGIPILPPKPGGKPGETITVTRSKVRDYPPGDALTPPTISGGATPNYTNGVITSYTITGSYTITYY